MLVFPNSPNITWQNNLPATPSNTAFTTVTAHATIHTKGDYAELIASSTYDSHGFWLGIFVSHTATTDTSMLLDIALGAAAAEVDILSNFMAGFRANTVAAGGPSFFWIPLFIPAGSRVSARLQALISADTLQVCVALVGGRSSLNGRIYTACDTYGANTADSGGTAHTPGNTGAESTDATIGTATRDYSAVMLGLQMNTTAVTAITYHWELTYGTNTICEWVNYNDTAETMKGPFPSEPFNVAIANGAAMQVQAEASGTAQAHDVALYCFY